MWIVDDSPTEALITERSLGSDFEFERFADGSIVVERFATTTDRPDVMLLDWVMPGMAGDEVCRYLRADPSTRHLPIILVTASRIDTADIVQGLANGANDYVARPFAPEELRARVDAVIRSNQLREIASRERGRLDTVNLLSRAVLSAGGRTSDILDKLASTLTVSLCDGCSILLLPGQFPATSVARHRGDPSGEALAAIAAITDPTIHTFAGTDDARHKLPPAYQPYVERFGLRSLAILPFPVSDPVQGVVTVTRDGNSTPFEPEDIATLETCIEYAALAVQTALQLEDARIARDQLNAVLDHLPIGIIATDDQGAPTLINPAAALLVPPWTRPDGSTVDHATWLRAHTLSSNEPAHDELELVASGVRRTIQLSAVPLRDGRGRLVGAVTALEDVSAERAIAVERDAISKFQQQLLGIVGHDLRNPLAALTTGLEILQQTAATEPAVGSVVRRLGTSTRRMTRIVEQLLDVTRARLGGGIPMDPREVQLVPLVRSTIEELALAYPDTSFELNAPVDVTGQWDPDRLSQVFANVMSNAVQYGRPKTPIQVEVAPTTNSVAIAISNTNRERPIPPEMIAVLFDPYRRGRDEARHQAGLGLGLYIVHEIVVAHGGRIDVESNQTTTVFQIMLPLHTPLRRAPSPAAG